MKRIWLLLLACSLGCESKTDTAKLSPAASVSVASAVPSVATPAVAASAVALPATKLADAKAFVARWEAAQNSGDFTSYSALYAERFMGVKRVGDYSKRFDRAAWLQDRKPMLAAGAQVKVSDLELSSSGGSLRAVFTQSFTAKTFKDTGKKELFLLGEPGAFAISREEMLSSDVGPSGAGDESVLAFQRDGVVLQRGYEKTKLQGQPKLLSSRSASNVEIGFAVMPDGVSPGVRAWLGKELTVYDKEGKRCVGRVSRFEVRVDAVTHFGMRQSWNGELDAPKASSEQIAVEVGKMAQDAEHFVVGVLDKPCAGTWASAAAPPFLAAQKATGAIRQAAIAAFKALPAYTVQQRDFEQRSKSTNPWESVDGELNVFELHPAGKPSLLLVTARGGVGCDAFSGQLSAFWRVDDAVAPKLTAVGKARTRFLALHGALDEGDAGLALLVGPYDIDDQVSVVRPFLEKNVERVLHHVAFWDCGC